MKTDFTRQEARDFLADLLVDENDIKQQTLFDVPRDYTAKQEPKWTVQGLTLVYVTHTCENCGSQHVHTSPKLLLNEALIDHTGTVLKISQTARPKKFSLDHSYVGDNAPETPIGLLNLNREYLEGESTDFCVDCIEEIRLDKIHELFFKQQSRCAVKKAGERMERIAEAQAKVAGKNIPSADKANMLADLLTANANDSTDEEV